MEKEWWGKTIKRFKKMSIEDFNKLVEEVDEVQFPFPVENIVLPETEKEHGFHNAVKRVKKQGFVKGCKSGSFEDFLHNSKEER